MKSMNRMVRSWLAACLAVIMCLSLLPIQARAAGTDDIPDGMDPAQTDGGTLIAFDGELMSAEIDDGMINVHVVDDDSNVRTENGIIQTEITFSATQALFYSMKNSAANPHFTVQYCAHLSMPATTGTNALTLIDTSGGKLPVNGKTPDLTYLYVGNDGNIQYDNVLREVYQSRQYDYITSPNMKYINVLTQNDSYTLKEIWISKQECEHDTEHALCESDECWEKYTASEDLRFTNRRSVYEDSKNEGKYMLITDGAVMRFIYDTNKTDHIKGANFYDYDISNGRIHRAKPPENPDQYVYMTAGDTFDGDALTSEVLKWAAGLSNWDNHLYAYTKEQGINSSGNYSGSGTKLAFGNVNTGTNLGKLTWSNNGKNNELNKYNNSSYQGCTFGIVSGLNATYNEDGERIAIIQYASGIQAPKLFNEGTATGKTAYDEYNLNFARNGDTYTLQAFGTGGLNNQDHDEQESGEKENDPFKPILENLNAFSHPKNSTGTHTSIWTNNFWPMDAAPSFGTGTHDVKFGATETFKGGEHEIRFGPITQRGTDYTFPESDDGKHHNSYFGMNYSVDFNLTSDYIGPLEYYFFGDDDMWVFLDGKLVCDIGGVHSSVGEYVNLWDYFKRDAETGKLTGNGEGKHTLDFFYTERGASGSTCFMQFTLPSVDIEAPKQPTGNLMIQKDVTNTTPNPEDTFTFEIKFMSDNKDITDQVMLDDYSYSYWAWEQDDAGNFLWKEDGTPKLTESAGLLIKGKEDEWDPDAEWSDVTDINVIHSGTGFTLRAGEKLIIKHLPVDTRFVITEIDDNVGTWTVENGSLSTSGVDLGTTDDKGQNLSGTVGTGIITEDGDNTVTAHFVNVYHALNEMPKTGGSGTAWIYMTGLGLLAVGGVAFIRRKRHGFGA